MPTLEEVLSKPSKAKVVTTLDAKHGFYQISLDKKSSKLTTFWTPFGQYQYLCMPSGINAASEEFECKLHAIEHLSDLQGVEVLQDDILVIGSGYTLEEATSDHDENFPELLKQVGEVNMKFNTNNLNLWKPKVKHMRHVLSSEGLKPELDKVKAVKEMPKPTCKQEALSMLWIFLPQLSEIAQAIHQLTTKYDKFICTRQHDKSFKEFRKLVTRHLCWNTTTWT